MVDTKKRRKGNDNRKRPLPPPKKKKKKEKKKKRKDSIGLERSESREIYLPLSLAGVHQACRSGFFVAHSLHLELPDGAEGARDLGPPLALLLGQHAGGDRVFLVGQQQAHAFAAPEGFKKKAQAKHEKKKEASEMDGFIGWMDGWIWMDGFMDGWMDVRNRSNDPRWFRSYQRAAARRLSWDLSRSSAVLVAPAMSSPFRRDHRCHRCLKAARSLTMSKRRAVCAGSE